MEMRGRHRDMSERMGNKTEKINRRGAKAQGREGERPKWTHRESK